MQNIFTPIDLLGDLITQRAKGESLADYRDRVVRVASVLTKRDISERQWRAQKQKELAARVGADLRLRSGLFDEAVLQKAQASAFTFQRLSQWEGPLRWPEQAAHGQQPLFDYSSPVQNGVGSEDALQPMQNAAGAVATAPGYVVVGGKLYYAGQQKEHIRFDLPAGTTSTVIFPYQIISDHGHRIEPKNSRTVLLIGNDHTHEATLRADDTWRVTGAGHTHALVPREGTGPVFMATGPQQPETGVNATADNNTGSVIHHVDPRAALDQMAIPVLDLEPVWVETVDEEHAQYVSAHQFYSGHFTLRGVSHNHVVTDFAVQEAAGHTHEINVPDIPENRLLLPVSAPSTKSDPITRSPFITRITYEDGWMVAHSAPGTTFGRSLMLIYTSDNLMPAPRGTGMWGLGPAAEAEHVHIQELRPGTARGTVSLLVRVEDKHTGGVAGRKVKSRLRAQDNGFSSLSEAITDETGTALLRFTRDTEETDLRIRFEVYNKHEHLFTQSGDLTVDERAAATGYGINYGWEYGN